MLNGNSRMDVILVNNLQNKYNLENNQFCCTSTQLNYKNELYETITRLTNYLCTYLTEYGSDRA